MHDVTIRKKAMISLPMKDITREEILDVWNRAKIQLEKKGYIVVSTIFPQSYADMEDPLWLLSLTINKMSDCEAVYFCDGWEDARGCRIEHDVAEEYGLDIIYAEDEEDPEAKLTDEQKTFLDGMKQTEIVLDSYFDMIIDTWSKCSEEYQRSAKIIKNGVIKWLNAAKFERYTDFVKENESKANE